MVAKWNRSGVWLDDDLPPQADEGRRRRSTTWFADGARCGRTARCISTPPSPQATENGARKTKWPADPASDFHDCRCYPPDDQSPAANTAVIVQEDGPQVGRSIKINPWAASAAGSKKTGKDAHQRRGTCREVRAPYTMPPPETVHGCRHQEDICMDYAEHSASARSCWPCRGKGRLAKPIRIRLGL